MSNIKKGYGSTKLNNADDIHNRMKELMYKGVKLNEEKNPGNTLNKTVLKEMTAPNGIIYALVQENTDVYIKKKTKNGYEYINGIGNSRDYAYPNYSTALKNFNLLLKEINEQTGYQNDINVITESNEKKKVIKERFIIKQKNQNPSTPSDMGSDDNFDNLDDLNLDNSNNDFSAGEEMDNIETDIQNESDPEKAIQKQTGKLVELVREANPEIMTPELFKYIVNSIISARDLDFLENEDKLDIIRKLKDEKETKMGEPEGGYSDSVDNLELGDEPGFDNPSDLEEATNDMLNQVDGYYDVNNITDRRSNDVGNDDRMPKAYKTMLEDELNEVESDLPPEELATVLDNLKEGYRPYRSVKGDPFWITAKYDGTDSDGTSFKRGERILYFPNGKKKLAGEKAKREWERFESNAADEEFMSGGLYENKNLILSKIKKAKKKLYENLESENEYWKNAATYQERDVDSYDNSRENDHINDYDEDEVSFLQEKLKENDIRLEKYEKEYQIRCKGIANFIVNPHNLTTFFYYPEKEIEIEKEFQSIDEMIEYILELKEYFLSYEEAENEKYNEERLNKQDSDSERILRGGF